MTGLAPSGPLTPSSSRPFLIGPYRVSATIGTGGMGTVFKGIDPQGRAVAIKMIGGSQLNGTALIRAKKNTDFRIGLIREAKVAAELRHPNIVHIHDIGQHRGSLYIVMELLDGMPLDRYARSHPISAPEALRIVAQVCDALDCAHNQSIIHRDVKPANTFILSDGTVKVLDFGIALPPDENQTPQTLAGTPLYMSPEQILGKELDGRSDIWSAGVTLFELLTTKTPFQGRSTAEICSAILNSPTPKLPFVGPIAEQLNELLAKALAKNPQQRYSCAHEFARELRSVIQVMQTSETLSESNWSGSIPSAKPAVNHEPKTRLRYESIDLRLRTRPSGPVLLFPFPIPKREGRWMLPGLINLTFLSVFISGIFAASLGVLTGMLFFTAMVALICVTRFFNYLSLRPMYRCRSCGRRMRRVSKWWWPTSIADQNSFCIPDCVAALKSGLWEEAVKLLGIYSSPEGSGRKYILEFFECAKCTDQRAYLTLILDSDDGWELRGLREAYRFGTPGNAQPWLSQASLPQQKSAAQAATAASATVLLDNRNDLHNQRTA